jgi:6-phosphofructokinase 1
MPLVGVPKTIDNDLSATDYTFGFDTAVWIATEAIDRLHTTAESHNRVMVLEVMGRHTGWIAVMSGIAGGADVILIPEQPITVEDACEELRRRHERGKDFSIVVVSEGYELTYASGETRQVAEEAGASDQFGHVRLGGVGDALAREIEERTGFETRVTVLGHVQRGGSPTPRDRVLATRYGLKAADLVHEERWGTMAALHGDSIVEVTLADAVAELKTVPPQWYDVARAFFG